ncbi:hypothetical protein BH20ACT13_BH20ACT13_07960 [soil metagenome]
MWETVDPEGRRVVLTFAGGATSSKSRREGRRSLGEQTKNALEFFSQELAATPES